MPVLEGYNLQITKQSEEEELTQCLQIQVFFFQLLALDVFWKHVCVGAIFFTRNSSYSTVFPKVTAKLLFYVYLPFLPILLYLQHMLLGVLVLADLPLYSCSRPLTEHVKQR